MTIRAQIPLELDNRTPVSRRALLAIDPGSEQSALLVYDTASRLPVWWAKLDNHDALAELDTLAGALSEDGYAVDRLAIEMIASYGMAVGATVFETCVWVGRFVERWFSRTGTVERRVFRRDVKLHLCGSPRAKDSNIRQALIDRYGPGKDRAVGVKASPGVLYGMKRDCWSALAVAITAAETMLDSDGAAA